MAGCVGGIKRENNYPVNVEFEDGKSTTYTHDGRNYAAISPTLKPYPHRIEIHRIEAEFEKGQIVLVRDEDNEVWRPYRFVEIRDGIERYVVYISDPVCTARWKQCIPFKGNEHLLLTTETP